MAFPSSLSEYHVGKVLGKGSFGTVYEAKEKSGEMRTVALKVMKKSTIRMKGLLSRVLREIKIHRPLKHPNIVSLLHYFEDKRVVCLVLELCPDGQTVLSMLREHVKLWEADREKWAKRIIRDVANGLAYLHERGIVHRDVKLSNLLWFPCRGGGGHDKWGIVKIADFGLARKMDPKVCPPTIPFSGGTSFLPRFPPQKSREVWASDEHGTVCGTPDYMSPEVIGRMPASYSVSPQVDLWSLGILFYKVVTGLSPFSEPGTNLSNIFERMQRTEIEIPDTITPSARNALRAMLSKDFHARPASSQDVLSLDFFQPREESRLHEVRLSSSVTMSSSSKTPDIPRKYDILPEMPSRRKIVSLRNSLHTTRHGVLKIDDEGILEFEFAVDGSTITLDPRSRCVSVFERGHVEETIAGVSVDSVGKCPQLARRVRYMQRLLGVLLEMQNSHVVADSCHSSLDRSVIGRPNVKSAWTPVDIANAIEEYSIIPEVGMIAQAGGGSGYICFLIDGSILAFPTSSSAVFCRHVGVNQTWKKMEIAHGGLFSDHINRLELGLRKKEAPAFAPSLLHHLSLVRANPSS